MTSGTIRFPRNGVALLFACAIETWPLAWAQTPEAFHLASAQKGSAPAPTVAEAEQFITQAEARLLDYFAPQEMAR